jgi:hypothetical protein
MGKREREIIGLLFFVLKLRGEYTTRCMFFVMYEYVYIIYIYIYVYIYIYICSSINITKAFGVAARDFKYVNNPNVLNTRQTWLHPVFSAYKKHLVIMVCVLCID